MNDQMNHLAKLASKLTRPTIVFESVPDFADNTRAVYDEMVRRGYGEKYNLVWFIDLGKCATIKKDGSIEYWNPRDKSTPARILRGCSFYFNTKCIICCNRFLPSQGCERVTMNDQQIAFYLSHGTPMKSVKDYYTTPDGIDYMLSPAEALNDLMAYEFSMDPQKIFAAGFPRNDALSLPAVHLRKKLGVAQKKIIIWYPTYRQHKKARVVTSSITIPIIHDAEKAMELNEIARDLDVLLILKPHFAQDVSKIRDLHLSNIKLINDDFFDEHGITSYELLAGSDALLTDYSSVYFDYTLCDKPIGVIWEDIEEYRQFPGFAVDLDYYLKGAVKIYDLKDFSDFLNDVAAGTDRLQAERREIRDLTNYSTDGKNAERVVDFIAEKARF